MMRVLIYYVFVTSIKISFVHPYLSVLENELIPANVSNASNNNLNPWGTEHNNLAIDGKENNTRILSNNNLKRNGQLQKDRFSPEVKGTSQKTSLDSHPRRGMKELFEKQDENPEDHRNILEDPRPAIPNVIQDLKPLVKNNESHVSIEGGDTYTIKQYNDMINESIKNLESSRDHFMESYSFLKGKVGKLVEKLILTKKTDLETQMASLKTMLVPEKP